MGNQLSEKEILEQSKMAFAQWETKWRSHAHKNGELYQKSGLKASQLAFSGYGRQLIVVAMGASLEKNIDTIKQYQSKPWVDIAVVDKGLKVLLEHGIKPKYVFLADAGISFSQWVEPVIEQTSDIALIASITANTEWTQAWKGPIYFYVNKDNIGSQEIFGAISGCQELIPASSNVGNAVVVFSVQFMGYDEYLLVGYDFGWNSNGNYYAYNDNDKRYWMRQLQGVGIDGELVYTSANLNFSRKWLEDYCIMASSQGVKIFNCSGQGTFTWQMHDMEKRIDKFKARPLTEEIKQAKLFAKAKRVKLSGDGIDSKLDELKKTGRLVAAEVAYIPAGA